MKRIYYAAMTVVFTTMSFTGCSSDEVTVTEPEPVTTHSDDKQQKQDDEPNNNGNQPGNNGEVTVKTRNIDLTDAQKQAVSRNNDFAFKYYRQLAQLSDLKDKSFVTSPLSVTYAMGMLNDGAKGATAEEITKTLGFEGGSSKDVNELCMKLIKEAPMVDEKVVLKLADCIVTNYGTDLYEQYQKNMADYYKSEVFNMDFAQRSTIDFINNWCNKQTEGMIKDIIDELSPEARIVLMNAIYFRAVWSGKFSEENTKYEPFTAEDGQVKQVAMMHKEDAVEYTNNNTYSTIGLPYGNGKNWRMYVLLPNAGKTVADILAGLTNNSWSKNVERMYGQKIDVKLPRFKTESELGLNDVIRSLGAPTIFSGKADFSAMSSESLFVSLIKQKAAIEVSEEGTEASAITIVKMDLTIGDDVTTPTFHADHPFVYLIQEASSGAIFFMGTYQGN